MTGCIDEMQQIVLSFMIVDHGTCLRFDRDPPFSLDVELVKDLFVTARFDGASELEQPIAESAFAMINMGDNAEIAETRERNLGDAFFEWSRRLWWRNSCRA